MNYTDSNYTYKFEKSAFNLQSMFMKKNNPYFESNVRHDTPFYISFQIPSSITCDCPKIFLSNYLPKPFTIVAQSTGAVEYTDWISADPTLRVSWIWHKAISSQGFSNAGDLGNVEYPFISVVPRFTLTWSGSTWKGPIYEPTRTAKLSCLK